MNVENVLSQLEDKLDDEARKMREFLSNGRVENFEEYKRLCGVIQGLDLAQQIITALAQRLKADDDDSN